MFIAGINIHCIFAENTYTMIDDFEAYAVSMDGECLHQDFDDVDLFGEKLEEDFTDSFGDDLRLY